MRFAFTNNLNTLLFDHNFRYDLNKNTELQDDEKEITYRQYPIIMKNILQWILLVFVHFGLFWYLPSHSNHQIQNHYY